MPRILVADSFDRVRQAMVKLDPSDALKYHDEQIDQLITRLRIAANRMEHLKQQRNGNRAK